MDSARIRARQGPKTVFGANELAYIANHYIYLDHDQRYSLSGGVSYRLGGSQLNGDLIYGSGPRRTPDGTPPNSGHGPGYATVNLALIHDWTGTPLGTIEGRLTLINLFDKSYLLRDGTGVGVGAPQYGMRRTFYAGLATRF